MQITYSITNTSLQQITIVTYATPHAGWVFDIFKLEFGWAHAHPLDDTVLCTLAILEMAFAALQFTISILSNPSVTLCPIDYNIFIIF